jgi:hypothetical protein
MNSNSDFQRQRKYLLPMISSKSDGEAVDGEKTAYDRVGLAGKR